MKITEINLVKTPDEGNQLAYGSIVLDGQLKIAGIGVYKDKDGVLFVGYPSCKNSNNEHRNICYPMSQTLREDIQLQVLSKLDDL